MNLIDDVIFEAQESSLSDMTEHDGFHLNLDDIDLSLLRLSSSPDSLCQFPTDSPMSSAAADSPMKRPSPDSDISDQHKRRKILVQKQDSIDPSVFSGYPENPSSSYPTRNPTRSGDPARLAPALLPRSLFDGYSFPVSEDKETTTFKCRSSSEKTTLEESPDSKMLTMINDRVKEMNQWCKDLVYHGEEEHGHKKLEDASKETREEDIEEESEEGMRIERSGDGYVIRLKCRCQQAYRVLFADSHFYFKLL